MTGRASLSLFFIGVMFAGTVDAANTYPVPLYMPDIEYPKELLQARDTAEVKLRIFIKADGGVRFIEMLNATRPSLIATTKRAVEEWRFKPWTPSGSNPEGEALTVTFRFSNQPHDAPPLTANADIKKLLCSQLNKEVKANESRSWEKRVPHELNVFRQTEHYFSRGPVISKFLPAQDREQLIMDLYESASKIIASCRDNPTRRYVDYLPEGVRNAL